MVQKFKFAQFFPDHVPRLLDSNDYEIFLFQYCCKHLKCVSLLNVYWYRYRPCSSSADIVQQVLMKFVRNAPSLRWFQSQLTPENIAMLRLERREILFLN